MSMNWTEPELKQMLLEKEMKKGLTVGQALIKLQNDPKWADLFRDPEKKAKDEKSKMGNVRCSVDGMSFHSTKEGQYYSQLKLRLRSKDIRTFAKQVPFILNEADHGNKPVIWIADFVVWNNDNTVSIIDIKPAEDFLTKEYRTKKRLFESMSGLKIEEVYDV